MSKHLYAYKADLEYWLQEGTDFWLEVGSGTPAFETEAECRYYLSEVQDEINAIDLIVREFKNLALHQFDKDTEIYEEVMAALDILSHQE